MELETLGRVLQDGQNQVYVGYLLPLRWFFFYDVAKVHLLDHRPGRVEALERPQIISQVFN